MTLLEQLKTKSKEQLITQILESEMTQKDRDMINILKKKDRVTLYELKTDYDFDSHSANRTINRLIDLGVVGSEKYKEGKRIKVDYFIERLVK
ncbi:MAG: hypothetical protein KJI69_03470 [Patescibacteria group bacterium]|nr:hypothetical protein [Patescibacteria group bacterium]